MSMMERVSDPTPHVAWLESIELPEGQGRTAGFDCDGWEASTWVLHAMWENPALRDLGTHDDWEKREKDLTGPSDDPLETILETAVATGGSLGFVARPGPEWRRLRWSDHATEQGGYSNTTYPPNKGWFSHRSWPVSIEPPAEGSLDSESLVGLLEALLDHFHQEPACLAYYASLPAGFDFDTLHVWRGPLSAIPTLLDPNGADYMGTPSNFWPEDRSWLVYTDWDLTGTKVSGSRELIEAVKAHPDLETVDWPREKL